MKAGLSTRSVYANIIILVVTMAISGCIPYVFKYTGAKPSAIQVGSTSKAKIVKKFRSPNAKTLDGRFFIYDYSKDTGWCMLLPPNFECSIYATSKGWVLIEFDTSNIVKHRWVHVCTKSPDPLCDQPGIDIMWAMINQFVEKDIAAQYGQTLDEFREAEALQNSRNEALVKAVKLADLQAVQRLIEEGADVNAENKYGYYTPLLAAASDGLVVIAKFLLSNGADVNQQNQIGRTPLHEVSWNGHVGVAELLLTNGADVDARDSSGATPLHQAVANSHVAIIKLLLTKGADLNARDWRGDMPLHRAIRIGDTTVVKLLLTHGADANAKDKARRYRPIKIAQDLGGRDDIIELLKQYGGKE